MKKTEFINTVAQILVEWYPKTNFLSEKGYTIKADDLLKNETPKQVSPIPMERPTDILPKGEYRITMEDMAKNVAPSATPVPHTVDEPTPQAPERLDQSECCGAPMEWEGLTPYCTKCGRETEPMIAGGQSFSPEYKKELYEQFKHVITEDISFPSTKIGAIYEQYRNMLKEDLGQEDFNTKIRGVYYQYAQGAEKETPTTKNPTRNPAKPKGNIVKEEIASVTTMPTTTSITPKPEEKPEAIIAKGQGMKKVGDATEKLGQIQKDEENKAKSTATIAEYVESEILPAVVEILKQGERPRAKKRELMEMFKLNN